MPELKDALKHQKVAGNEFLTLSLNGKMIPWDEIPVDMLKKYESEEGQVDKLLDSIKKMTFVVAIGLRDDFLLVSMGSSTNVLQKLGQGCPSDRLAQAQAAGRARRQAADQHQLPEREVGRGVA